ncbi:MAG: SEC-C metal-binding domain-containing protein, partial [Actinomycetota bacterium]|nr:SEC-C metal-binding domain-containing protein [Actinomycetota bacterium]
EFTRSSFQGATDSNGIYEAAMEEVLSYCEQRENEIGPEVMRQVEGQIMLRILDQRWREHLYAMDYLKEGIHLRAMGQKDPLTEWQREGFEMFGAMMDSVGKDFIKYITHIQVDNEPAAEEKGSLDTQASNVSYSGTDEIAAGAIATLTQQKTTDTQPEIQKKPVEESVSTKQATIVKSEFEKTGRNEPCPCGSGKKFKQCHGK